MSESVLDLSLIIACYNEEYELEDSVRQIVEILDMPALYPQLPRLFEIQHFESREIAQKASELELLVEKCVVG
jgi:hypothetical protein